MATVVVGCGFETEPIGSTRSAVETPVPLSVCDVDVAGTLAAGDAFAGTAHLYADATSDGAWEHLAPERTVTVCTGGDDDGRGGRGHCRHGRGHGYGHYRHGRGHGYGHDRHHCGCEETCTTETVRDAFAGVVDNLSCLVNGHSDAFISGSGTWNGAPGYTFDAEVTTTIGGDPTYDITIYDPSLTVVYSTGTQVPDSGTIAITGL